MLKTAARLTVLLTATFLVSTFVGCDSGGGDGQSDSASEKTIGLSVQTLTNPFFTVISNTLAAEGAKHGYKVLERSADHRISEQKDQVKEFIAAEVDAIVLCPVDTKAIGEVILECNGAGIPVFTIDTICEDPRAKVTCHVGTDNLGGGRVAGQAMIDALGTAGGQVAVLEYKRVESCLDRVRGFKERIATHNDSGAAKIELVTFLECGGNMVDGQNATRDALNAHPGIKGIFAINDPSALGARAALEQENKANSIVVVGFDGQPEAKQAIKDGKLFDSPVQFPDRMAIKTIAAVVKYFNGEEVQPVELIPTEAYRKADAAKDPALK